MERISSSVREASPSITRSTSAAASGSVAATAVPAGEGGGWAVTAVLPRAGWAA
jgi:hypothetical protein